MKSPRFPCLLVICISVIVRAQSDPVALGHQPLATDSTNGASQPDHAIQGKIVHSYGKLPLSFEANHGQTDARVNFLSRGSGYTLFLTGDEAVFTLRGNEAKDSTSVVNRQLRPRPVMPPTNIVMRMKLLNANLAARVMGTDELGGTSNYFIGNNSAKWRTGVPTYAKVKYEGIYSGIDLIYYGNQRQLEYDFVVAPGADPGRIHLKFRGAGTLRIDDKGDLVLGAGRNEVRLKKPKVYQEASGTRQAVEGRYWMAGTNTIGFRVEDYDRRKALVIDPVLVYSTYLGGSGTDGGFGIALDSSGNAYVTGYSTSTQFPGTSSSSIQSTLTGSANAFVAKINATGSALVYSTYLGGIGYDEGDSIAVDSSGNAYVTGYTESPDFPTMNPLQPALDGLTNAFVAKINAAGRALLYSTYLGGSGSDQGYGIAVDGSGNAYVTGYTDSADFPGTGSSTIQPFLNGTGSNAFVAKINAAGSALAYSTYLGGGGVYDDQVGFGIAVDSTGNAYVTGHTGEPGFPGTSSSTIQSTLSGYENAFVAKINAAGSALVYSTYLGGDLDGGSGIAVDGSGNAYVTGFTTSTHFPGTSSSTIQSALKGNQNAFVAKINATGSALVYSTYLGGSSFDLAYGIAVDPSGNAYVTGYTESPDFPGTSSNTIQSSLNGYRNAFVSKINAAGSALAYSTYLGGSSYDDGFGIAVDSAGDAYITGLTSSTNFPRMNPLQPALDGDFDAFVTMIAPQTFASLIKLVEDFDTKPDVRAAMVFTLELAQAAEQAHAAKSAAALLDLFIDEVKEQSGKSLTAAEAGILTEYAKVL